MTDDKKPANPPKRSKPIDNTGQRSTYGDNIIKRPEPQKPQPKPQPKQPKKND